MMSWEEIVDLKRELVKVKSELSVVTLENASLREKLARREKDYRLLGQYYEASLQIEEEMADLCWEKDEEIEKYQDKLDTAAQMLAAKDEEIESNKDFIKELSKTNEVALDRLAEARQKIVELEKQVALLQQQKCRAEGKLEKCENYLRMFTGRENW